MAIRHIITISTLVVALAAPLAAQTPDPAPAPPDAPTGRNGRPPRVPNIKLPPLPPFPQFDPERLYDQAREAIENSNFDQAVRELDRVIGNMNNRNDAAIYWKAYSQSARDERGSAPDHPGDGQAVCREPGGQGRQGARARDPPVCRPGGVSRAAGRRELELLEASRRHANRP